MHNLKKYPAETRCDIDQLHKTLILHNTSVQTWLQQRKEQRVSKQQGEFHQQQQENFPSYLAWCYLAACLLPASKSKNIKTDCNDNIAISRVSQRAYLVIVRYQPTIITLNRLSLLPSQIYRGIQNRNSTENSDFDIPEFCANANFTKKNFLDKSVVRELI